MFSKSSASSTLPKGGPHGLMEIHNKPHSSDKLKEEFLTLEKEGITRSEYKLLYDALIENASYADKLATGFVVLKNIGAILPEYKSLYTALIKTVPDIANLATALAAIRDAGATLSKHPLIFEAAIYTNWPDSLAAGFEVLKNEGITLSEYPSLYKSLIRAPIEAPTAANLATILLALQDLGATPPQHPSLYEAAIYNTCWADELAAGVEVLKNEEITLFEHPSLYEALMKIAPGVDDLVTALAALKDAGATLSKHPSLYEAAIYTDRADKMAAGFKVLKKEGITLSEHQSLYNTVISQAAYAERLPDLFTRLKEVGIMPAEQAAWYEIAILQINTDIGVRLDKLKEQGFRGPDDLEIIGTVLHSPTCAMLLKWFHDYGAQKNKQRYLYEMFFSGNTPLACSPYFMTKAIDQVKGYLIESNTPLLLSPEDEGYAAQREKIVAIIDDLIEAENQLSEGPLNRSLGIQDVELILKRIGNEGVEQVQMSYRETVGYILKFGEEPEIYLSALLRHANFNHIQLSSELIQNLGVQVQRLFTNFEQPDSKLMGKISNIIVEKLPEAAKLSIAWYIDTKYANINRLFRGVSQDLCDESWVNPVNERENLIINFLVGCLLNWSSAELPRSLLYSEERQILQKVIFSTDNDVKSLKRDHLAYTQLLELKRLEAVISRDEYDRVASLFPQLNILFPEYGLIDRGENFTDSEENGELGAMARRTANPVFMPSVTSFSVFTEGVRYFHRPYAMRTKLETSCSTIPVINPYEGEILIPAGTAFRYTKTGTGTFFARIVNSPGLEPVGGIKSSYALIQAYDKHLSQPYSESNHSITIDSITIARPNHGLAHTGRVMMFIDIVINYFACHASDKEFQTYCQNVTPNECDWIRVAAAYSITGRESEVSAGENLLRYNEYKNKSMEHMKAFLEEYYLPEKDSVMREQLLHVVRWMGNPGYEKGAGGEDVINNHANPVERKRRNFIHRILTVAHQLDLPRCYGVQQFESAMAMCLEHSLDNAEQKADYIHMIRYAIDLIRAHGNALSMDISPDGQFKNCVEYYRAPFQKVSTNLRQLWEITDTVTRPRVKEKYQFTEKSAVDHTYNIAY